MSASLIFIVTLISRLSGFFREVVMADFFGTSTATDAWLMASALPNLLFSTINGAITVTVVPLMTQADAEYSPRSVARFLNEVFTALFLISAGLIALGEVFAPLIMHLMAPGFHGGELRLTIDMTRIMIPTIFFWGIAGLVVGILQEREEYVTPAISPMMVNIVRILTIVILGHFWGIRGVAAGFTLAVISQLLVTVPSLHKMGIHLHFRWHFSHPLLKKMINMAGPFFLTSSVGSVGVIVDRILASSLVAGSIAALNYSYVLVQMPIGLVISSLSTPIYTRLAQHHSHREDDTFRQLAMRGFRLVLLIIVPMTIWYIALRIPLLQLLYQRGAFNARSTALTSGTLLYFALGLPGFSLSFYLQRLFFATQDTKSPSRFSIATILINIIGDIILVHFMKADGLALATSFATWVNAALLTWKALQPRYNQNLQFRRTLTALGLAGGLMLVTTLGVSHLLHLNHLHSFIGLIAGLASTVILSGLVFIGVLTWLRFPDLREMEQKLVRRLLAAH
ncbi:integral membrane protein MviN [Sulfobacillus acidophilus TPY]|nr:integral membrane protein MviN [Sulfobacillus acidophilus TPY]